MKLFHEMTVFSLSLILGAGYCALANAQQVVPITPNTPPKSAKLVTSMTAPVKAEVPEKASAAKNDAAGEAQGALPVDDGTMHLTSEGIKKYSPATLTINNTVQNRVFRQGKNVWIVSRRGTKTIIGTNQNTVATDKKLKPIGASRNQIDESGKLMRIDEDESKSALPKKKVQIATPKKKVLIPIQPPATSTTPTTQNSTGTDYMTVAMNGAVLVNP